MSGVIDKDGTQWERCNGCTRYVNIDDLLYDPPSEEFKYGRDLCRVCYLKVLGGIEPTPDPAAVAARQKAADDYRRKMEGKELKFTQVGPNAWAARTVWKDTGEEVHA
jgi:hypothetical protein